MVIVENHTFPFVSFRHGEQTSAIQTLKFGLGTDFDSAYRFASFMHLENKIPVLYVFNGCGILTSRERSIEDARKKYHGASRT